MSFCKMSKAYTFQQFLLSLKKSLQLKQNQVTTEKKSMTPFMESSNTATYVVQRYIHRWKNCF